MPRICGPTGCVNIPDQSPQSAAPSTPSNAVLGYDAMGKPVYAGQEDRAIVSQSPQNPVPQPQRPMGPFSRYVGPQSNPIQASIDLNYQLHPEGIGERIGNAISSSPAAISQAVMGGNQGSYQGSYQGNSSGGGNGWSFQPILPGELQSKYETLYGNALDKLNQRMQNGINPLLNQARTDFYTKTVPSLAESFTSLGGAGGQRSSAFQGALGAAGAGLEQNLAGLQYQHDQDQQSQLMKLLQMSPYDSVYEGGGGSGDGQQGGGSSMLSNIAQAVGEYGLDYATGGATTPLTKGVKVARAIKDIYGRYKANQANQPYESPQYAQQGPNQPQNQTIGERLRTLQPDQQNMLNNISRNAAPGNNLTPQQVQQIQSITGGVSAGDDFARTFRQPQPRRVTFPQTPQQQARYAGFNRAGVL